MGGIGLGSYPVVYRPYEARDPYGPIVCRHCRSRQRVGGAMRVIRRWSGRRSLPPPLPPWPSYRQVRRYCRAVVRITEVTPPLQPQQLCEAVGRYRERPIHVEVREMPPKLFGFSVGQAAGLDHDWILAAANTTELHRDHIILHELGHVLSGHLDTYWSTAAHDSTEARQREWVAESIATALSERALLHSRRFGGGPADPLDEALRSGRRWI